MSATTNGCPYFTTLYSRIQSSIGASIKIKSISGICMLFVVAAVMNAGSANATILTKLTGTELHVTNNVYEALNTEVQCGDGSVNVYNYRQRMVINGKVEMVLTEFIYAVGTYEMISYGQCNGSNVYGLGSCSCLKTDLIKQVPVPDLKTVATVDIETTPQEVFFKGGIQSMVPASPAGSLWIRKDEKELINL